MLLRKKYIVLVVSALLLALIFFGVKMLHREWRIAYTTLFQKTNYKVNLIDLQFKNIFDGIYRPLVASREKGLPVRRLYISQKAQNKLMRDLPMNTRKWQQAFMIYPDGRLRRVKARHRGDNPANWAFHKKSWRVKMQKSLLIDNTRVFNLVAPQEENQFSNYLANYVGSLTGVLSPRVNLVELFVNDKPQGIYHEMEHIDESFLRNNRLMPVNIYKGEQANRERQILIGNDLFDNPGLWSKVSTFNQLPETDYSDLEYVLDQIHKAETSGNSLARLKRMARFDDWARFSAFQTLIQSWHNAQCCANLRLVVDPWQGSIRPVVHDTLSLQPAASNQDKTFDIVLDAGKRHPFLSLYHNSSDFLVEKYRMLYKFVRDEFLLETANHFEARFPAMERSFSRDYFRYEKIYTNDHLAHPVNFKHNLGLTEIDGMKADWKRMAETLRWFQTALLEKLKVLPDARWMNRDGFFGLVVNGTVPLDRVTLEFSPETPLPKSIAWDADGDGHLSAKDIPIPFRIKGSQLELDAVWTANRIDSFSVLSHQTNSALPINMDEFFSVPTQFRLVSDTGLAPVAVRAANFLTGEIFLLVPGSEPGNTPTRNNIPVIEKKQVSAEIWSGNKVITGAYLMDRPVRILPGTTLRMRPGASLVFRHRIEVEGTQEAPVRIVPDVPGKPWGTVALHGPSTAGSVLSYLSAEGGSGTLIENIRYIGMLSVHEAKDVKFLNLKLRKNHRFDDMMHVVYSEDILIQDCVFENAFSDGLDVDISTIRIQGCRITASGNDAIDLMDSKALIMESELSHSGDKGISIGEASQALIYNSHLHHNVVGVESKDGSVAHITNSTLAGNKRQINAYKKNWHYGSGGRVVVDKSIFDSLKNTIKGDKKSDIKIFDSAFTRGFGEKDKQVVIDSLSDGTGEQKAASADYQSVIAKALMDWGIIGNADQRGILQ